MKISMEITDNTVLKPFSKKTELFFLVLSIIFALGGSILVAMSGSLSYEIYDFLQNKVFHRPFSFEKWATTINALITFPIFFGIFFDSIFFVKFSNRTKIILLSVYAAIVFFFIAFCAVLTVDSFMNSDMAADLLLGRECWLKKTFWPRTWHYSTEIRLLNMQLFSAPIFAFTSNFHIVKVVSATILSLLLPLSMWFLLNQLKLKTSWIKFLTSLLILAPWSLTSWEQVQLGSYYVTLISSCFFYSALCLGLMFDDIDGKRKKNFLVSFFILSFVLGLSSIRYILQISFPMELVVISLSVIKFWKEPKKFEIKDFFINNKLVFYPTVGLLLCVFGYLCNSTILSRLYSFSSFGNIAFNGFNKVPVMRWVFDILENFGYRDKCAVFSPSGVINVFIYVFIALFLINTLKTINTNNICEKQKVFVLFSITMFIFNAFVFINTDYYNRYMLILQLCLFPCFAVLLDRKDIFVVNRYLFGVSASIVLLSSTFVTFSTALSTKGNEDNKAVIKFLKEENYTFGYADFWDANVTTFLTNGKIEVQRVDYLNRPWLTTKRYNAPDYKINEKVFLLLSSEECEKFPEIFECEKATKIYEDNFYTVLDFETNAIFRSEWGKDHLHRISLRTWMLERENELASQ